MARDPALTETADHRHQNRSRVPDVVSRRRKAAPSAEDEPLKSARSAVCAHHAPLPVTGGESKCHVCVLTVPLCSAIKLKNTKLTSISGQFSSSHSPLPHHSLSHSCGIKLPPSQRRVTPQGVQSASPAVTVHRSMAGTISVGYEINKERLHASVLPQTAPFQRCVNVHCKGAECLSSVRGNTQPPRKAGCRDIALHRAASTVVIFWCQRKTADSAQSWT